MFIIRTDISYFGGVMINKLSDISLYSSYGI